MVASKEEYKKALLTLRDKNCFRESKYLDMLRAQYESNGHTITSTNLAKAVGYKSFNGANLYYGKLAHLVADALSFVPQEKRKDGKPIWHLTLSEGNEASDERVDGQYEFVMRSELRMALEEMTWVKRA